MLKRKRKWEPETCGNAFVNNSKVQRIDLGPYFLKAAAIGDLNTLFQILDVYPDIINEQDYSTGYTAIHVAAKFSQPVVIDELLKRKARVDIVDVKGVTPLFYAYQNRAQPNMSGKVGNMYQAGYRPS